MRIGIDIGGTHTDSVLIDGTRLVAAAKAPTNHDNLLESISQVLHLILAGQNPAAVTTLNLSTTLNTNAIVTGRTDPVGMLVVGGPGIAPENYRIGEHFHLISGSLDHLGTETAVLDEEEVEDAITSCRTQGVACFAVASKFSPRNPAHEKRIQEMLANQAVYLGSSTILLGFRDPQTREDKTLGGKVAKQVSIWAVDGNQPALWPNTLELSTDFRDGILEHHVPINNTAMHALDHNALAQDFYVFFTYRLHALDPSKPTKIPWAVLHQQFEGVRLDDEGKIIRPEAIQSYYPWRKRAIQAIGQVLPHYPDARVEITRDYLILRHSKPPVSKILSARLARS